MLYEVITEFPYSLGLRFYQQHFLFPQPGITFIFIGFYQHGQKYLAGFSASCPTRFAGGKWLTEIKKPDRAAPYLMAEIHHFSIFMV